MASCDTAVILAAGIGKRMKSKTTKVLHHIMGKPMLSYLIDATAGFNRVFVVKKGAKDVCELIGEKGEIAFQRDVLGTGNALLCAKPFIKGDFVVVPGDVPLLSKRTIKGLISFHFKEKADATILAARVKDPKGYGRIIKESRVRGSEGQRVRIVEEKDASEKERKVNLVNTGIYCFNKEIFDCLERLDNKNKQGEYYLTDAFKLLSDMKKRVSLLESYDEMETMGINTRYHLAIAEDFLRKKILREFMESGVTIKDINSTYIERGVQIGKDTTIFPNTYIFGKTIIGEDCTIGPCVWISNSKIYDKVRVYFSYIENSIIKEENNVYSFFHQKN
ncbi:MAG: sugar phosphate nucleotidyltransferase [bacterium]